MFKCNYTKDVGNYASKNIVCVLLYHCTTTKSIIQLLSQLQTKLRELFTAIRTNNFDMAHPMINKCTNIQTKMKTHMMIIKDNMWWTYKTNICITLSFIHNTCSSFFSIINVLYVRNVQMANSFSCTSYTWLSVIPSPKQALTPAASLSRLNLNHSARFEVLTEMMPKTQVFWNTTLSGGSHCFEGS